jgi:alpha-beta hydrolase superfamily lysophospholipase
MPARPRLWLGGLLIAILLAAFLPGCGSDEDEKPATAAPRSLEDKCGDTAGPRARPFWLTASDGARLYAVEAGRNTTAVVLAHQSPSDLCGWLPYLRRLTGAGLRVIALDFRGFGDSRLGREQPSLAYDRDLRAGVAHARSTGAERVFLIGASFGGATALAYAHRLDVDGVISLSGETSLPSRRLDGLRSIRRFERPLLVVGSRHDRYLSVAEARALLRRAGSTDKELALYPGWYHGWEIVEGAPYAAEARALILDWIQARATDRR